MLSAVRAAGCIRTPDLRAPYLVVPEVNLSQPDSLVNLFYFNYKRSEADQKPMGQLEFRIDD